MDRRSTKKPPPDSVETNAALCWGSRFSTPSGPTSLLWFDATASTSALQTGSMEDQRTQYSSQSADPPTPEGCRPPDPSAALQHRSTARNPALDRAISSLARFSCRPPDRSAAKVNMLTRALNTPRGQCNSTRTGQMHARHTASICASRPAVHPLAALTAPAQRPLCSPSTALAGRAADPRLDLIPARRPWPCRPATGANGARCTVRRGSHLARTSIFVDPPTQPSAGRRAPPFSWRPAWQMGTSTRALQPGYSASCPRSARPEP